MALCDRFPDQLEQAKKHIFLETAIGVDVEGCKRAIKAAKQADKSKTITVGLQQRSAPLYLESYKRIQKGDLGELATSPASWIAHNPFTRKAYPDPAVEGVRNWFCYRALPGDIIAEQDRPQPGRPAWVLGGVPLRTVGNGSKRIRKDSYLLDNIDVVYAWPNGLVVNYHRLTTCGVAH